MGVGSLVTLFARCSGEPHLPPTKNPSKTQNVSAFSDPDPPRPRISLWDPSSGKAPILGVTTGWRRERAHSSGSSSDVALFSVTLSRTAPCRGLRVPTCEMTMTKLDAQASALSPPFIRKLSQKESAFSVSTSCLGTRQAPI